MFEYSTTYEERRRFIQDSSTWNGIDYLEIQDTRALGADDPLRQRQIKVFFLNAPTLTGHLLPAENFRIEGGERVRNLVVTDARVVSRPGEREHILLELNRAGDFSIYTLRLVRDQGANEPPLNIDPLLATLDFSFKVECPNDFDCAPVLQQPPERGEQPPIDYLTRDYAGFRRLLLDRLTTVLPARREENPADNWVALTEVLAYVADYQSYYLDSVSAEAYLTTARLRPSLRRHARLLDYQMHDGCNSRVWVCFFVEPPPEPEETDDDTNTNNNQNSNDSDCHDHDWWWWWWHDPYHHHHHHDDDCDDGNGGGNGGGGGGGGEEPPPPEPPPPVILPLGTRILTRTVNLPTVLDEEQYQSALLTGARVFETRHEISLLASRNEILFYLFGEKHVHLPAGATTATVLGYNEDLQLEVGDVLVFEEVRSYKTGLEVDAERENRHAVRLTHVSDDMTDELYDMPYLEISWAQEDALPFTLQLGDIEDQDGVLQPLTVIRGNVALADYGRTLSDEDLFPATIPMDGLYRPRLRLGNISFREPLDPELAYRPSARDTLIQDPRKAEPDVTLTSEQTEELWVARRDLLNSDRFATEFVVETENDGRARLRFGDNVLGKAPAAGSELKATYRVGNGAEGNMGPETLAHLVSDVDGLPVFRVYNPLSARGGTESEPMDEVRLYSPEAFKTQKRAVSPDDYASIAERHPEVQKAVAYHRWTGSWYTIYLALDRVGGRPVDEAFRSELFDFINIYRLNGYDLEIREPRFISLEIKMRVRLRQGFLSGEVRKALLDLFSSGIRSNGELGFFHPDNFTFGQPVYLSRITSLAMNTEGVAETEILKFGRYDSSSRYELEEGVVTPERLEIVRLDNDPNAPENGKIELILEEAT